MLKPVIDFVKQIAASYGRLTKSEENIKKILAHSDEQDDTAEASRDMLRAILHEIDKDRAVAAEQRKTAERDYENLVLRLQLAMKDNEQRALPPGSTPQNTPELEARLTAIENAIEDLRRQIEELKKP